MKPSVISAEALFEAQRADLKWQWIAGHAHPERRFDEVAVRDAQSHFRIVLGPLSLDAYRRFLPGGPHARQLAHWVREYVGIEFDWDVQLELAADAVPAIALGAAQGLGRTAWLGQRLDAGPARDLVVRYDARRGDLPRTGAAFHRETA